MQALFGENVTYIKSVKTRPQYNIIPQTVLALRGSYFASIVIALEIAKAGRQVPKPRCPSLEIRIAGRQVPKPRCLSPAANSLEM